MLRTIAPAISHCLRLIHTQSTLSPAVHKSESRLVFSTHSCTQALLLSLLQDRTVEPPNQQWSQTCRPAALLQQRPPADGAASARRGWRRRRRRGPFPLAMCYSSLCPLPIFLLSPAACGSTALCLGPSAARSWARSGCLSSASAPEAGGGVGWGCRHMACTVAPPLPSLPHLWPRGLEVYQANPHVGAVGQPAHHLQCVCEGGRWCTRARHHPTAPVGSGQGQPCAFPPPPKQMSAPSPPGKCQGQAWACHSPLACGHGGTGKASSRLCAQGCACAAQWASTAALHRPTHAHPPVTKCSA